VPPPIPPRSNREKDIGAQGSSICHVSTTYIGGSAPEMSPGHTSEPNDFKIAPSSKHNLDDEVTIGNQSTHSSQVSVTNKQKQPQQIKQTGLQLKISVNSSSNSSYPSPNSAPILAKKQTISKVPSQSSIGSSSNNKDELRSSRRSKDGPKIKKLRDLLLADSDVESS